MRSASRVALLGASLLVANGASLAAPAAGSSTAAQSDTADPLAVDSLMNDPRNDIDLTTVDPADWAPEHASREPGTGAPVASDVTSGAADTSNAKASDIKAPDTNASDAKSTGAKSGAATATTDAGSADAKSTDIKNADAKSRTQTAGKSLAGTDDDPEPDAAVVPPPASPSNDPLDRPRPAAGAAPAKINTTKTDATKTDATKTDAKTDATKKDATTNDAAKAPPAADAPAQQAAEPPLPPANAAIKAALDRRAAVTIKGPGASEKRKERDAVAFFYAAHGFAPAWSENGKAIAAAAPVLARLAKAGDDALSLPDVPKDLKTDGNLDDVAASDLALTEAVVAYARQATGARVDPHSIGPLVGARPELADPAEVLDGLIAAGPEAGDKLAALNPSDPRYAALREKLAELRGTGEAAGRDGAHGGPVIPDGPLLKIGMRDERVPLLRTRFHIEATSDADDADLVYDAHVAAAVKAFQRSHGIPPLGMLGARTVAALNGGAAPSRPSPKLEGVIIANMEMWRWMPHDMGRERIEVNIPDYAVTVFHDNAPVAHNRVVVGKTETPTPIFSNTMKYLIVNPVWNVPQSIIQKEMHGVAGRGFTSRYVHGRLFIQQQSGPKNALGQIKFMFPNQYSVYLHDTPAKHLFATTKRAYSHGCVRVDKPFDFADSVLNDAVPEGGKIVWTQQRLQKMLGTTERYVNLPTPLPIHIEYFTASVDDGRLTQRDDVYGYAGAVAAALGYGKPPALVAGVGGEKTDASVADAKPLRKRRVARRYSDDDAYDPRVAAPQGYEQPRGFVMPW